MVEPINYSQYDIYRGEVSSEIPEDIITDVDTDDSGSESERIPPQEEEETEETKEILHRVPPEYSEIFHFDNQIAEIDNFATSLSKYPVVSFNELIKKIKSKFPNNRPQIHLVRCFSIYIISNFPKSNNSGNYWEAGSPEIIFNEIRGGNFNYARLMKEFCQKFNIKCEIISGNKKKIGNQIKKNVRSLTRTYYWNAVEIGKTYKMINLSKMRGEKNINNFYFLTPPKLFIYDHFPHDSKYQYLNPKWDNKKFNASINTISSLYNNKMWPKIVKPKIKAARMKELILYSYENRNRKISAKLYEISHICLKNSTYVRKVNQNEYAIDVYFPNKAKYIVKIFDHSDLVASYIIKCTKEYGKSFPIPIYENEWDSHNFEIITPQKTIITTDLNGEGNLIIKSPHKFPIRAKLIKDKKEVKFSIKQKNEKINNSFIYNFYFRIRERGIYEVNLTIENHNLLQYPLEAENVSQLWYPDITNKYMEYQNQGNIDYQFPPDGILISNEGITCLRIKQKKLKIYGHLSTIREVKNIDDVFCIPLNEKEVQINVCLKNIGDYFLEVFGKPEGINSIYQLLFSIRIQEKLGYANCFPKLDHATSMTLHPYEIKILGMKNSLMQSQNGKKIIDVRILKKSINIYAILKKGGEKLVQNVLQERCEEFSIFTFLLPQPGIYKVKLKKKIGQRSEDDLTLSKFEINEQNGNECSLYPKFFDDYCIFCKYIESISQLSGNITSNSGEFNLKIKTSSRISFLYKFKKKLENTDWEPGENVVTENQKTKIYCELKDPSEYIFLLYAFVDSIGFKPIIQYSIHEKTGMPYRSNLSDFVKPLNYLNQDEIIIENGKLELCFEALNDIKLEVKLFYQDKLQQNQVYVQKLKSIYKVHALLNYCGKYKILIDGYRQKKNEKNKISKYYITSLNSNEPPLQFPIQFSDLNDFSEIEPNGYIQKQNNYKATIMLKSRNERYLQAQLLKQTDIVPNSTFVNVEFNEKSSFYEYSILIYNHSKGTKILRISEKLNNYEEKIYKYELEFTQQTSKKLVIQRTSPAIHSIIQPKFYSLKRGMKYCFKIESHLARRIYIKIGAKIDDLENEGSSWSKDFIIPRATSQDSQLYVFAVPNQGKENEARIIAIWKLI